MEKRKTCSPKILLEQSKKFYNVCPGQPQNLPDCRNSVVPTEIFQIPYGNFLVVSPPLLSWVKIHVLFLWVHQTHDNEAERVYMQQKNDTATPTTSSLRLHQFTLFCKIPKVSGVACGKKLYQRVPPVAAEHG